MGEGIVPHVLRPIARWLRTIMALFNSTVWRVSDWVLDHQIKSMRSWCTGDCHCVAVKNKVHMVYINEITPRVIYRRPDAIAIARWPPGRLRRTLFGACITRHSDSGWFAARA